MMRPILVAAFLMTAPAAAFAGPECEAHAAQAKQSQNAAAAKPSKKPAAEVTHTCPMHPKVEQKGPGKCPDCGMFLEPKK